MTTQTVYSVTLYECTHNRWHVTASSPEEAVERALDGFGTQVESYDCPEGHREPLAEVVGVDVDLDMEALK